jgi:hypothetical protein
VKKVTEFWFSLLGLRGWLSCGLALKAPRQISPGQRPGDLSFYISKTMLGKSVSPYQGETGAF